MSNNNTGKVTNLYFSMENKLKQRRNSFDYISNNEKSITYHKIKLPKKRSERKKYPGYACECCKKYYTSLGLNEKDLKLKLKSISRHRGKSPPKTPEHYWEIDFPDTQECIKRGYIESNTVSK